jgi:hypothetical protein
MNDIPPKSPAPLDEELVAYLDGELDAEGARRIEALLALDPDVRRRLQSFERTWDLLDELEAAPVGEPFTHTTLEMVALAARQDVEQDRADAPRRRRRWLFLAGVCLLAAALSGFVAVALHDPDRELLQNLPLLENLDEYRQIGSIEFLHKLRDEKLFSKDIAEPPKSDAEDDADTSSRRRRIANMSLDEKEQLLRSESRFTSLSPEEQRSVWRLHQDLQNDPERERLRAIMHDYCEWLKPLSPLRWEMLAEMTPNRRVASVKALLREEQRRKAGRRPGQKDLDNVWKWMNDCTTRHETALLASMPEPQRKGYAELSKPLQHQMLFGQMMHRWQTIGFDKLPPMVTEKDLARLRANLTSETRKRLEAMTPVEQWRLLADWMRRGPWHPDDDRPVRNLLLKDDDERIADFFENDLSPDERDRLLAMPGDEMQWRLQEMFLSRSRLPEGPGRRGDGPPKRNRRPGDAEPTMPWPTGSPLPPSGK